MPTKSFTFLYSCVTVYQDFYWFTYHVAGEHDGMDEYVHRLIMTSIKLCGQISRKEVKKKNAKKLFGMYMLM
jgi:hypothetical protein